MQESSTEYFKNVFSNRKNLTIEFSQKKAGVQLGFMLTVKDFNFEKDNNTFLSYHIKTHQYGTGSKFVSRKMCDIKELFVYKVLNKMGILPEFHYFYYPVNSREVQFCIATLDVIDHAKREFNNNNSNIPLTSKQIDLLISNPDIEYYLTFVDIITKIFVLSDILTNSTNYIFIMNGKQIKLYVFDLQVKETQYNDYYSQSIFDQFCLGDNYFSNYCHKVLKERTKTLRLKDAKRVIENLEGKFNDILEESYLEIFKYFDESTNEKLKLYKFENFFDLSPSSCDTENNLDLCKKKYGDINLYIMYLKKNFNTFSKDLKKNFN